MPVFLTHKSRLPANKMNSFKKSPAIDLSTCHAVLSPELLFRKKELSRILRPSPPALTNPGEQAAEDKADRISRGEHGNDLPMRNLSPAPLVMGTGVPLPSPFRAFFEPKLGADFSAVRIFRSGEDSGTPAWAAGTDIVFARNAQGPETPAGLHTLGHELVHVVQQQEEQKVQCLPAPPQKTPEPRGLASDEQKRFLAIDAELRKYIKEETGKEPAVQVGQEAFLVQPEEAQDPEHRYTKTAYQEGGLLYNEYLKATKIQGKSSADRLAKYLGTEKLSIQDPETQQKKNMSESMFSTNYLVAAAGWTNPDKPKSLDETVTQGVAFPLSGKAFVRSASDSIIVHELVHLYSNALGHTALNFGGEELAKAAAQEMPKYPMSENVVQVVTDRVCLNLHTFLGMAYNDKAGAEFMQKLGKKAVLLALFFGDLSGYSKVLEKELKQAAKTAKQKDYKLPF